MEVKKETKKNNDLFNKFKNLFKKQTFNSSIKKLIYKKGENKLVIEVNPKPNIIDRLDSISIVANFLFSEENIDNLEYIPQLYDFALRYGIVTTYTNLVLPSDIDYAASILLYTPIFKDVVKRITKKEADRFERDLKELIEVKKQSFINSTGRAIVIKKITDFINKGVEQYKNLDFTKIFNTIKEKLPADLDLENIFTNIK